MVVEIGSVGEGGGSVGPQSDRELILVNGFHIRKILNGRVKRTNREEIVAGGEGKRVQDRTRGSEGVIE